MTPLRLFRRIAVAEAITWALLLAGMFLKYVTGTTELGVRVFGMAHGVVFIGYALVVVLVWVDQRWTLRQGVLGLACAVPPFATVPFDTWAERRGLLGERWRLREDRAPAGVAPTGAAGEASSTSSGAHSLPERLVAWLLRNPARGLVSGVVAVLGLTGVALLVGPPV